MKATPGEKQLTASVLLVADTEPQRVLLVNHIKHGCWLQPGGHVEPNENPLECALREAEEKTGLDLSAWLQPGPKIDTYAHLIPPPDYSAEYRIPAYGDDPAHYHVDWLYVVHVPDMLPLRLEKQAAQDIGWFTLAETEAMPMFANTHHFLRELLGGGVTSAT